MKKLAVAILLFHVGLALPQAGPATRRVSGRVTPAPGPLVAEEKWMRVALVSSGYPAQTLEAAVSAEGGFEFLNVPSGPYLAYVLTGKTSYIMRSAELESDPVVGVYVEDRDVQGLDLHGPIALKGSVLVEDSAGKLVPPDDPAFRPLSDLRIEAGGTGRLPGTIVGSNRAEIRANGDFILFVKPRREYRMGGLSSMKSMRYGNVDLTKETLRVDPADPADIVVTLTAPPPRAPGVTVRGRVTGLPPGGVPPGVRVMMRDRSVDVDRNGEFEFQDVTPGTWELTLVRPGMSASFSLFQWGLIQSSIGGTTVQVGEATAPPEVLFRWTPLASIETKGVLLDKTGNGAGLPDARIVITSRNGQTIAPPSDTGGPSDTLAMGVSSGSANLTLLPPGEFDVRVAGLRAGYILKSILSDGADLTKSPLKIDAATESVVIEATIQDKQSAPVRGRIVRTAAAPLLPTQIFMRSTAPLVAGESIPTLKAAVTPNGTFEFSAVPPGKYALESYPDGLGVNGTTVTNIVVGGQAVENVPVIGVPERQVMRSLQAANEAATMQNLEAIQKVEYFCDETGQAVCSIRELVERGLLDPVFEGTLSEFALSGYTFTITGLTARDGMIIARPVSAAAGRYVFYATASAFGQMWLAESANAPAASALPRDAGGQMTTSDGVVLDRPSGCGSAAPLCVWRSPGVQPARPADSSGRVSVGIEGFAPLAAPSFDGFFVGFVPEGAAWNGGALNLVQPDGTFKIPSPAVPGRFVIENVPKGFAVRSAKSGDVDLLLETAQSKDRQALPPIEVVLIPMP